MFDVSPDEINLGYLLLKFLRLSTRARRVEKIKQMLSEGKVIS
jgi:hypothetical protein